MALMEQIEKQLNMLPPEKQNEVLDFIVFLQQQVQSVSVSQEAERGKRIKAAFQTLADLNTFADITDPIVWQRQNRQDRQMPGRQA